MSLALLCPRDAEPLPPPSDGTYSCPRCLSRFPRERGVVRFLESEDQWYEGRYLNTIRFLPRRESPLFASPLWLMNSGWIWAVRRHLPAGATVVEMGCGSGVAYFAHRYRVVGLDLSFASLAQVAELYDTCLQADAVRRIPLPDGSVDGIVSSFVWEHIRPDLKPQLLAECARVLCPRGKLVFLYDVENDGPVYRRMRRADPDLYHRTLIENDDHLGWQRHEENRTIFEDHGFRILEHRGREKLFYSPSTYDKVGRWGGGLEHLARIGLSCRSGWRFQAYNALLRGFDETLGRLLPERWARVMITACEKVGGTQRSMPERGSR